MPGVVLIALSAWVWVWVDRYVCTGALTIEQMGHFGLGLHFYTHFTSPIRRYADVVVRCCCNHLSAVFVVVAFVLRVRGLCDQRCLMLVVLSLFLCVVPHRCIAASMPRFVFSSKSNVLAARLHHLLPTPTTPLPHLLPRRCFRIPRFRLSWSCLVGRVSSS